MNAILSRIGEYLLGRRLALDPALSKRVLLSRAIALSFGLIRGFIYTRRKIYLAPGARILDVGALKMAGGLVRLDHHARIDCTSKEGITLGRSFKLGAFSRLVASGALSDLGKGISIGDNVGIGEYAYIGGAGGVSIGSDTIVGQYFSVHPEDHVFSDPTRAIREQGVTRKGIVIGENCWIGSKVTILDGVTIGNHCVLASGAVVTSSFPDYSVIGGVPAKLLKTIGGPKDHSLGDGDALS